MASTQSCLPLQSSTPIFRAIEADKLGPTATFLLTVRGS
jgi:hypothetical protein